MITARDVQRLAIIASAVLWFVGPAISAGYAQNHTERSGRIQKQVQEIAVADNIVGRREAIVARIKAIGLDPELVWFDPPASARVDRRGANIVANIPGRTDEVILLGAHYDRVERGRGVIDNAGGVAAVLELAQVFALSPLAHYSIKIALFDLEEDGLLGSKAMVRDSLQSPLPAIFLNFDIFGYGNAFWLGSEDLGAPLPRAIEIAGRSAGLEVTVDSIYPSSDHVSFRRTSTRSFAISLLEREDVETLLGRFRTGNARLGETPKIFRIMHTEADTLDKLDAAAVARGVHAVEKALRAFDTDRARR